MICPNVRNPSIDVSSSTRTDARWSAPVSSIITRGLDFELRLERYLPLSSKQALMISSRIIGLEGRGGWTVAGSLRYSTFS